jgi:hypothetical protein
MLHCQHIALDLGLMWHHIETYMHHFQAKHVKKTVLCSNESWTQNLARSHPGQQAKHHSYPRTATSSIRKSDGKKQTTGDKSGVLKGTQEYTPAFGFSVAESFLDVRNFFNDLDNDAGHIHGGTAIDPDDEAVDPWEDLEISAVFEMLNSRHHAFDVREPDALD